VTLRQKIEHEIRERGPIPFSRYMELCLYDADLGYYSRNAEQFGKAGDFYTSSDVHAVFGRLLARQFEEMWRALGSPAQIEILELGPGRGLFAEDVLDWSEKKFSDFFRSLHYRLVETSPVLQKRLQATLERHFVAGKTSLCSASSTLGEGTTSVVPNKAAQARALAPEVPVIVFANECFDALPVEIFSSQGELRIWEEDGRLIETWNAASPEGLKFLDRYSVHPEAGERIEAPLIAQCYMSQIAASVKRGLIVAIDYGYTRQEQLAGRHRGTVSAYRQHSESANPYESPGEQDITAHVNFTALAAAAEQGGMQVQPLLTQSQFLLGIGEHNQFADAFEECRLPQERAKVALQLKHLITPTGMGESFHVLIASKDIDTDRVSSLSGLMFGKAARP
jgi:SAM-dependent MidA family methyltransferase